MSAVEVTGDVLAALEMLEKFGVQFTLEHSHLGSGTVRIGLRPGVLLELLGAGSLSEFWASHYGISIEQWAGYFAAISTCSCTAKRRGGAQCEYPIHQHELPEHPREFVSGYHDRCLHHRGGRA